MDTTTTYVTCIGLDVHARTVAACALNPFTGEVTRASFGAEAGPIAEWILGFESPRAVYESGVTGFQLQRELAALGVDCVVGAVSKMPRSAAQRRVKNDRADAEALARLLATRCVVEVMVPDEECEAERDLSRLLEDARDGLGRARQRMSKFLLRHGYVWNERNERGQLREAWTRAYWAWADAIAMPQPADAEALRRYAAEVRRLERVKKGVEGAVARHAEMPRWKGRVDALRRLKGIDVSTAFALVVEAQTFSRFGSAAEFEAWVGLVPSEHSSGETSRRGGITKAGNRHLRALLTEAAWHYASATPGKKALSRGQEVAPAVEAHAAEGNRRLCGRWRGLRARGKKPVVVNCAVARELAGWVWAIGRMCEGTM